MAIDKKFIDLFINVSSKAALASSYLVGKKDKIAADQAAVDSMRSELNNIDMTGEVVIGEGSLDEAPMLYTGEILGTIDLPATGRYGMMSYLHEGAQYIVVQVSSANYPGALAALRLP